MIISLNWLKEYVDIKIPTDELVRLIGARLVEVEEVIDLAPKYAGGVIVKVVKCEKIPDTHLNLCQIDDAGVAKNVKRGDDGAVQVVCGSPNIRAGVQAVWLPPGVVVPETYGKDNQVRMEARKLRGYVSNGMLAGPDELDFYERTDDVVYIDPDDAKPGDDFAEKFGLNDTLLDIENKSLTHRPDCFGVIGFAREVAGILGQKFDELEWFGSNTKQSTVDDKLPRDDMSLTVEIVDAKLCPRYQAVVMDLPSNPVKNYLSQMQTNLARSGMRSIDPVVDSTNDLMLMTGQPLHAFDYDKLVEVGGAKKAKIIVRAAKPGEKLILLDGKEIEMGEGDIVITSNNVPVALAGAMGGANTAIDKGTKRIVVESATFNLYNLRGTQFRHGIFSEAITRFTKGQPPALTDPVLRKFAAMTEKHYALRTISPVFDAYPNKVENPVIDIALDQINNLLGAKFTYREFEETLTNIGYRIWCDCGAEAKCRCEIVHVQAPFWRTDIHIPEDVIEDIGRINGYDNIALTLPERDFAAVNRNPMMELKHKIRTILSAAGANEVLTYSFVHGDMLKKAGQDPKNSYKIVNSISPDLQYYRQSLVPSLLDRATVNLRDGYEQFALFEINKLHQKKWGLTDEKVPIERDKVGLVLTGSDNDTAFYTAKKYAEELFTRLGIDAQYVPLTADNASDVPFETKRRAKIECAKTGQVLGVIGEFKNSVRRSFKLPAGTAGFELILDTIIDVMPAAAIDYQPLSRYPDTKRDMTFQVKSDVAFVKIEDAIRQALQKTDLQSKIEPLSIYQGKDKTTKNVSFRLTLSSLTKTLTGDEIAAVVDDVVKTVAKSTGAKII